MIKDFFGQIYSEEVLRLIKNPKNMGEIKNPDGVAMVGNPVCGDLMKFYIKVGKKGKNKNIDYIKDIKFQTLGCGAAIASSSMVTIMLKNKTLQEAAKISRSAIVMALKGLPENKIHCSVLADQAVKKAIKDYYSKN